jgi:hypothetical protein
MAPYANYGVATEPPVVATDGGGDDDPVVVVNKKNLSSTSSSIENMPVIVHYFHGNNNSDNSDGVMMMKETTTTASAAATQRPCSRSFSLRIVSNMIFVLASCLYVTLAVTDLHYFQSIQGLSDDVLLADDDATWASAAGFVEDDYVFSVGHEETWVSAYQMIYFSAALLFCIVGLLDFIQQPGWLSVGMTAAGCFGLISSMLVHKNVHVSNIFNTISVHLFMVEAIGLFVHHGQIAHVNVAASNDNTNSSSALAKNPMMEPLQYFIRVGDISWIGGTLIDVVLSYYALRGTHDLVHAKVSVLSSLLWLGCSMIYVTATCIAEHLVRKQFRLEEKFEKSRSPPRQTRTASSEDESA